MLFNRRALYAAWAVILDTPWATTLGLTQPRWQLFLRLFVFCSGPGCQVGRGIVDFAPTGLLDFVHKGRSIVALGIGQRVRLALVIPTLGIQTLRLFEMRDRFTQMSGLIDMLTERKLGRS